MTFSSLHAAHAVDAVLREPSAMMAQTGLYSRVQICGRSALQAIVVDGAASTDAGGIGLVWAQAVKIKAASNTESRFMVTPKEKQGYLNWQNNT